MATPPAQAKAGKGKMIAIVVIVIIVIAAVAAYYLYLAKGGPAVSSISVASGTGNSNGALNFNPQILYVVLGRNNTVTFANNDNTNHTVTFVSAPSGVSVTSMGVSNLLPGQAYTVTLTVAGTYQYKCSIHNWMSGEIVVSSGGARVGY